MEKYRITLITGLIWLTLDTLTKWWAMSPSFKPIVFVQDVFYFSLHQNTGIAFGIPLPFWFQIVISIVLMGVLLYWSLISFESSVLSPAKTFLNQLSFGIILGGAVGNFIDRVAAGAVTDFIKLTPFPIFNIADVGITVGIALLILSTLHTSNK